MNLSHARVIITTVALIASMMGISANAASDDKIIPLTKAAPKGERLVEPTPFNHTKHVDAAKKLEQGCNSCHYELEGVSGMQRFKIFKGITTTASKEIKDQYHKECIGCHTSQKQQGMTTGPTANECRSCHVGTKVSSGK